MSRNYRYFRDYAIANAASAPAGTDSILGIPVVSPEAMAPPDVSIEVAGRGAASVFDVMDVPPGNGYTPPPNGSAQPRTEVGADVGTFWLLLLLGAGVLLWSNRKR